jgi:hypothetical protein
MLRVGIILTATGFIAFVLGLLGRGRGSPRLSMTVGAVLFVAGVVLLLVALV